MKANTDIHGLVRDNIRQLKPYRSARDDFDKGILLDANENSLGAPFSDDRDLHRYPMPLQKELRKKIADFRSVSMDQVFTGVGSDEAIDLLFRIFCEPGKDRVLINPPTYGMYKVSAQINDVEVDEVLLDENFQLQTEEILRSVKNNTKLIFICSPNNPTANLMKRSDIESVLRGFSGLVIVDEAYVDFSSEDSLASMISEYSNLVILQTLSKSFGLAGIRLGIALAHEDVISYMLRVKAPYNINKLTSESAIKAFDHVDDMKEHVQKLLMEKERVADLLSGIPAIDKIWPSDANFLLFQTSQAHEVYKKMAGEGVIIRYRGNEPGCENGLRLTIGTRSENDFFIQKIQEVINKL